MEYDDNPDEIIKYINNLGPTPLNAYLKGYMQACSHIREALTKGKSELLADLLPMDEEYSEESTVINTCIRLLDRYEEIVIARESLLKRIFPQLITQKSHVSHR